jgi:Bacterial PH domain
MGLLSGLMGNASEVDATKLQSEFSQVLASGERVEKAYQLVRDMFVFTDKRLIFVNRQGLTGSKVEYPGRYRAPPRLPARRYSRQNPNSSALWNPSEWPTSVMVRSRTSRRRT